MAPSNSWIWVTQQNIILPGWVRRTEPITNSFVMFAELKLTTVDRWVRWTTWTNFWYVQWAEMVALNKAENSSFCLVLRIKNCWFMSMLMASCNVILLYKYWMRKITCLVFAAYGHLLSLVSFKSPSYGLQSNCPPIFALLVSNSEKKKVITKSARLTQKITVLLKLKIAKSAITVCLSINH